MKVLALMIAVAALAVAAFIGYRATQPKRHCTVIPASGGHPGATVCYRS